MTKKYNIDESHGVSHSMNVLHFAHDIYSYEVVNNPNLKKYEKIIYVSAVLHDMCDKKYVNELDGLAELNHFLVDKMDQYELSVTNKIISTMSYSTVKKFGFPDMKEYTPAYHIVREADLLSAYDFDRCIIYNMHRRKGNLIESYHDAVTLFEKRVFKHYDDGLLVTEYSKKNYLNLHNNALNRLESWKRLVRVGAF
jgi:HD superfamily phosphodiesterase